MKKHARITHETKHKLHQIRKEALSQFKQFISEHGTEEMKQYDEKLLTEILFHRRYAVPEPEYNHADGLEYHCVKSSL